MSRRFGRIGGSSVGAVMGISPFQSPHGLYLQLRKEAPPFAGNKYTDFGIRWEPLVADMFQMAHSEYKVVHNRKGTETPDEFTHPDYDFLVSHPDRLCRESEGEQKIAAGLEIKTTNWMNFRQYGEEGTDKIPDYYLTQVIFYLGMTGLPIWHVAVAFLNEGGGLRQYKEFLVHNDKELYDLFIERCVEFYQNHVLAGNPPEITQVDETTRNWLTAKFDRNTEPIATATENEEKIMVAYIRSREELRIAQEKHDKNDLALRVAIANRDGLRSDKYGQATWKKSKDSERVDWKGLCNEFSPTDEQKKKYTKIVSGTRRLLASGLSEPLPETVVEEEQKTN
jgi:predicted phage-related endonuclease